jgi:hypothetical protein
MARDSFGLVVHKLLCPLLKQPIVNCICREDDFKKFLDWLADAKPEPSLAAYERAYQQWKRRVA